MDKKKIQIALVGGQTMPVLLGLLEFNTQEAILIHSSGTKQEVEKIKRIYKGGKVQLVQLDPVNIDAITEEAKRLLNKLIDYEVTINLSSGTKQWTIIFAQLGQKYDNVSLVSVDQNNVFYDYTNHKQWRTSNNLPMESLLAFNGDLPQSHTQLTDYSQEDLNALSQVRRLRRIYPKDFQQLTTVTKSWQRQFDGGNEGSQIVDRTGSSVYWKRNKNLVQFEFWNKQTKRYDRHVLVSPHIMSIAFNSGWFEYQIASMLQKWPHSTEVWLNVHYNTADHQAKNEIDIIVNTGLKLLFVECKTKIFAPTDIDKFYTAVRNYGGTGSKALFITETVMSELDIEKCKQTKMITFSLKQDSKQKTYDITARQNELFKLLDKELLNINAR